MELNFSRARLNREPAARALIEHLDQFDAELKIVQGSLYFEFPPFREEREILYRSTVLLASRSHGIIVFKALNGDRQRLSADLLRSADEELDQIDSLLFGKLLRSPLLRTAGRQIAVPVTRFIFVHDVADPLAVETRAEALRSFGAVNEALRNLALLDVIAANQWEETLSVIEGAKGLLRPKERILPENRTHSKAATLSRLENEIANFDRRQRRAAITLLEGPQRIRGLAGSGKTVVLAMKAAQLHLTDPSADILFTFYTKSLYDFIKLLITRFFRHYNEEDPDFEKIHIRHAWGGRDIGGVYYDACIDGGVRPIPFRDAQNKGMDPFDYVCQDLLASKRVQSRYDYVLMDEAQDFPASFYRLCFERTKGGALDRNIVWAYDELQNIMNIRLRTTRETFGTTSGGVPLIDLDRIGRSTGDTHDTILYKCYRNPREILISAHALGFGIYSVDNMVQMLENKEHWEDVGYSVLKGNCLPGEETVIERLISNSPLTISAEEARDELVRFYVATNIDTEIDWLTSEIRNFLDEGLRPDDILVVALDDQHARGYFKLLTENLRAHDIHVNNLLMDPYSTPSFSRENLITLSTVYRAKGNEAPVVFAIGVDGIYPSRRTKQGRNKLFTAFTRAKAWLRVSGVGVAAEYFKRELEDAMELVPRMEFIYPNLTELDLLQRDLSEQAGKLGRARREMEDRLDQLALSDEEREALIEMLLRKKHE